MIRRINLALLETALAESHRQRNAVHPLAEYVGDWTRAHTLPLSCPSDAERSFTVSLNGQDD